MTQEHDMTPKGCWWDFWEHQFTTGLSRFPQDQVKGPNAIELSCQESLLQMHLFNPNHYYPYIFGELTLVGGFLMSKIHHQQLNAGKAPERNGQLHPSKPERNHLASITVLLPEMWGGKVVESLIHDMKLKSSPFLVATTFTHHLSEMRWYFTNLDLQQGDHLGRLRFPILNYLFGWRMAVQPL